MLRTSTSGSRTLQHGQHWTLQHWHASISAIWHCCRPQNTHTHIHTHRLIKELIHRYCHHHHHHPLHDHHHQPVIITCSGRSRSLWTSQSRHIYEVVSGHWRQRPQRQRAEGVLGERAGLGSVRKLIHREGVYHCGHSPAVSGFQSQPRYRVCVWASHNHVDAD